MKQDNKKRNVPENINDIKNMIEEMRLLLYNEISDKELYKENILVISQKLDEILNTYNKLRKK